MHKLKHKLSERVCLGLVVMYPAPGIVECIGADWDWIWLDGQHGQLDESTWLPMVRAADIVNRPAIIRVPELSYGKIGRALDTGAAGIIVPMINTRHQAEAAVEAARFPPGVCRSFGGRRPIDMRGRNYASDANEDILLALQIETYKGLENVEDIASTPGVDALIFGPDDMAMQNGINMKDARSVDFLGEELKRVSKVTEKAGILAGTTTGSAERLRFVASLGYRMCTGCGDKSLLVSGSESGSAAMKAVIGAKD